MEESNDYKAMAMADDFELEDITADHWNESILLQLRENHEFRFGLTVCGEGQRRDDTEYTCEGGDDEWGWLGYFIGKCTTLRHLILDIDVNPTVSFCKGMNNNTSITDIGFESMDLSGGEIFQRLGPFFRNNNRLTSIDISWCRWGAQCIRQLSLSLRGCRSLKNVSFGCNNFQAEDGELVDLIEALHACPKLECLDLIHMSLGRNECSLLTTLLSAGLCRIDISGSSIGDDGLELFLAGAFPNTLKSLGLCETAIRALGTESLASLLGNSNSSIEHIDLRRNDIGNKGALALANSLAGNCKVKDLLLDNMSPEGYSYFSMALGDGSSINKTFSPNIHSTMYTREERSIP